MKTKINKLMAYVYMPLIFTFIGIGILYIALAPVFELAVAGSAMLVSDDIPKFSTQLDSIFEEPEIKDVKKQDATINIKDINWPKYGKHYAIISCDRIKLKGNIYMGDDSNILKAGVGQFYGSFIPGYGRPILLAAHCTTFFAPFEYVKKDDIFKITTSYGIYEYKVRETKIVDPPFDAAVNIGEDKETLTMYTCYPFKLLSGSRRKRLFVYADKIAGPEIQK